VTIKPIKRVARAHGASEADMGEEEEADTGVGLKMEAEGDDA